MQAMGSVLDTGSPSLADRLGGDVPVYLGDSMLVLVFLAWLTVPVLLGYVRFRNADL